MPWVLRSERERVPRKRTLQGKGSPEAAEDLKVFTHAQIEPLPLFEID